MTMPTLDEVLDLAQRLSLADQLRLRDALSAAAQAARDEQRARNQAAIALLDSLAAEDNEADDAWWEPFTKALDEDRLSNRPLFPTAERRESEA